MDWCLEHQQAKSIESDLIDQSPAWSSLLNQQSFDLRWVAGGTIWHLTKALIELIKCPFQTFSSSNTETLKIGDSLNFWDLQLHLKIHFWCFCWYYVLKNYSWVKRLGLSIALLRNSWSVDAFFRTLVSWIALKTCFTVEFAWCSKWLKSLLSFKVQYFVFRKSLKFCSFSNSKESPRSFMSWPNCSC